MARVIRFPLQMKDGAAVRTLEELREHFDLESVLGYFTTGKLKTWFADRYYDEIAQKIGELSVTSPDLSQKLCEIIGVEYTEENADVPDIEQVQRRQEKLRILSQITDDKAILDNVDAVAFDQDELYDILDVAPDVIYLYGDKFSIPYAKSNIIYIGVNHPEVSLEKNEFDYNNNGILLKNVAVPKDQRRITIQDAEHLILEGKYQEAFPIIQKLAENGNARAMYHIALYYDGGYNTVEIDIIKRNELLKKAFIFDEPLAFVMYTEQVLNDDSKSNYGNIFEKLCQLSLNGDIIAQYQLGNMYDYGYGVEKDSKKAAYWYQKAAEQGYACAQDRLGTAYFIGYGVEKDELKAVEWYGKAAEQGFVDGQVNLGHMYEKGYGVNKDYTKAVEWYGKAAEQGDAPAQYHLGKFYQNGNAVAKDYDKAQDWYRKAADQGNSNAQFQLGQMFENGEGVVPDKAKAAKWYTKAAEQGNAVAQNNLGKMCENGEGVTQNNTVAVYWYTKAAEQGYAPAQNNLGWMYRMGKGVPQNYYTAVEWYKKSAEQGYAPAQNRLGCMYKLGIGVTENVNRILVTFGNREKALEWWRKAAEQGNQKAINNLKRYGYDGVYGPAGAIVVAAAMIKPEE